MNRFVVALTLGGLLTSACAAELPSKSLQSTTGDPVQDGVLAFVNNPATTISLLDEDVGLDSRAAENIKKHVVGPDWAPGTADDDLIGSIEELETIPYVKAAAYAKLVAYVVATGGVPNSNVEGVLLTDSEIQAILTVSNFASLEEIDVDAGLDSRAAQNIVAGRPYTTIDVVAALPYVGKTALEKLRDYSANWTSPTAPPAGSNLADLAKTAWNQIAGSADFDVLQPNYSIDPATLPAPAKALFDSYSQRFTWRPAQAWMFKVDGQAIYVVMDFGEEIYWNDLFDASGNKLAHGYDGDSGPSISTWDPSPYDPSIQP